jgi:hypothetical protein
MHAVLVIPVQSSSSQVDNLQYTLYSYRGTELAQAKDW